jgi:lipoprotein-releasing system ATP-binding protein
MTLEARGVCKDFGPAGGSRRVLDHVNLLVRPEDRAVIVGPSGAGKSTLLNLLGGIVRPSAGEILVDGRVLAEFNSREAAEFRNRCVGFVFQLHHLLPQFTLLENVLVPVLARGPERKAFIRRALSWLEAAGLSHRRDAYPHEVSVGESQRAAILRALINQPAVLLADEPTGSLDRETSAIIIDFLLEWREHCKAALIMVTHDDTVANRGAAGGRLLRLVDGRLDEAH